MQLFYHGSPNARKILKQGINLFHPRRTDVGDFGWALYLSRNFHQAKVYGEVLEVTINETSYAYIANPYFISKRGEPLLPTTPVEELFYQTAFDKQHNMLTLRGTKEQREIISKRLLETFLAHGYGGIITDHHGAVVFAVETIKKIEAC